MPGRIQLVQYVFLACIGYFTMKTFLYVVNARQKPVMAQQTISSDLARFADNAVKIGPEFAPFDPSRPKKVVVLTYQRCGSSFFGQLFNKNPQAFYMYEPLDAVYSAMYGVREGWNVPSDITTYWNGTQRFVTEQEYSTVSQFLQDLLSCDVDRLPTESLIHRFWFLFSYFHESLSEYTKCLKINDLKYTKCSEFTPGLCGSTFGQQNESRQQECYAFLHDKDLRGRTNSTLSRNTTKYVNCMDGIRTKVIDKCAHIFQKQCQGATLRATKTVRATMASAPDLLESDPNIRLIHLIRDPRAVVLSRKNFDSSARSHYARGDMVREAEIYCRGVVSDNQFRKKLNERYPGRIMAIIYEDLSLHPMTYAEEIYSFLNSTMPEKLVRWFKDNTTDKSNSTAIASKWQSKLTYQTAKQIMTVCQNFFEEIDYDFS